MRTRTVRPLSVPLCRDEQGEVHHKAAGEQWVLYKYIFIDLFYYFFTLHNTGLCRSSAPALSCYLFRGQ